MDTTYIERYEASRLVHVPAGVRVIWQGRAGTVIYGNLPSVWAPGGTGTVSLQFDNYRPGVDQYAEVFADEVTIMEEGI